jgi:hypothetical protein
VALKGDRPLGEALRVNPDLPGWGSLSTVQVEKELATSRPLNMQLVFSPDINNPRGSAESGLTS